MSDIDKSLMTYELRSTFFGFGLVYSRKYDDFEIDFTHVLSNTHNLLAYTLDNFLDTILHNNIKKSLQRNDIRKERRNKNRWSHGNMILENTHNTFYTKSLFTQAFKIWICIVATRHLIYTLKMQSLVFNDMVILKF